MTLQRLDENWISVANELALDVRILANEQVRIDGSTLGDIGKLINLAASLSRRDPQLGPERIVFCPDLHRGEGIPIGTAMLFRGGVIPKAVGSDIGCGVRLTTLDIDADSLNDPKLDRALRHEFFEGGRKIGFTREERAGIFQGGLQWLGNHSRVDIFEAMGSHMDGCFPTSWVPEEFLRSSSPIEVTYDDQIGSIGGGNHFVEIQVVDEIIDRHKAYEYGLSLGCVCVMAHSGSVGIGQYIGKSEQERVKQEWPQTLGAIPGDYYPALFEDGSAASYFAKMSAGANFAFVNRYYLSRMVKSALEKHFNRTVEQRTVYDAPHNLAWNLGNDRTLHRKGACPAGDPDEYFGEHPVLVPGSMGDFSYVLCGHGSMASLCSACHGAGRKTARKGSAEHQAELSKIRLITKIDPKSPMFFGRSDILDDYHRSLAEEAPSCYKDIGPAIETCKNAGVASPVARLRPILTIKGY